MKAIFLIGVLAVLSAAYSADLEDTEQTGPEKTRKPSPLPQSYFDLRQEIETFGKRMVTYTLNLTSPYGEVFFPAYFSTEAELLSAKSLLKKIYGTEFDRLAQPTESNGPDDERRYAFELMEDNYKDQKELLDMWTAVWFALENKTFEKYWEQRYAVSEVNTMFSMTFRIEKCREARRRFRHVFGPGLEKTTTFESLFNAVRLFERPGILDDSHRLQSIDGIPKEIYQKQLVEKIHTSLRRMYTYVYDLDPLGKDYMTGHIADHLKGFSIKSLLIFEYYLENTFGQAMSEIREKPQPTTQERREKMKIVRELKDMMATTLSVWQQELIIAIQKDVEFNYSYQYMFDEHANYLADFLSLEDLRRVYRRAVPILEMAERAVIIHEDDV